MYMLLWCKINFENYNDNKITKNSYEEEKYR
jgi:hypothetical protein